MTSQSGLQEEDEGKRKARRQNNRQQAEEMKMFGITKLQVSFSILGAIFRGPSWSIGCFGRLPQGGPFYI